MNDLFHEMEAWCRDNEASLKACGLSVVLSAISENAKPSRYIDIESNIKFGRLVVWASGETEIQIENFEANKTESLSTRVVHARENLAETILRLVKIIEPKYA